MVKKNCCVFISGKGTNLLALIRSSRSYNFPINIKLIISNRKNAKGILLAKKFSIPFKIINQKNKLNELEVINELKKNKISIICLAGYMNILPKKFIKGFNGKIINIHPSLLPKYKGLDTFSRVLKFKEKSTGCTVHYVNEKLDSGKIILKKKIFISSKDNKETLKKKVQKKEYIAFSEAIFKIYN